MGSKSTIATNRWSLKTEVKLDIATIQLAYVDLATPIERVVCEDDAYLLDLSLTPRLSDSRYSFINRWSSQRLERAGKVFLLPPGEAVRVRSGIGQQEVLLCHLRAKSVRSWVKSNIDWTDSRIEASLDISNPAIRNLIVQLEEEVRHPGLASSVIIESLLMQMTVHLHRYFNGIEALQPPGGLAPWRLRLISERIMEMDTIPSLSELADICKLSARQLMRGFLASKGISIGEYIVRCRLEQAKKLLLSGGSVKSVAYAVGFASPSSFGYAFRKSTGMSPGMFQQQIGSERRSSF